MRSYGMKSKLEITMFVPDFLAVMNGMRTPQCFRTENWVSSPAAVTRTTEAPPGFAANTQHQEIHSRTRLSRGPSDAR